MSVPNQRIVKVHREMPGKEGNFLQIKKSNLYEAYRTLNATALCLYLYLAGNKEGAVTLCHLTKDGRGIC